MELPVHFVEGIVYSTIDNAIKPKEESQPLEGNEILKPDGCLFPTMENAYPEEVAQSAEKEPENNGSV
jgi:hypothetical protein